jgi:8-oxo-dGTP diphosphatase
MAQEFPEELLLANVGQKVLVLKDGKVLMCRGKVEFKEMDKRWDFPGGRMHTGEEPASALTRELKEELGVDFIVGKPLLACVTYDTPTKVPRYYVVFEAKLKDPNAAFVVADDELSELKWIGRDEIETIPTWEDWRNLLRDYFAEHAA